MKSRKTFFIIAILLLGIIYKLALTSGGNFLFNMDNARDLVDVREMVVLGKIRLTGPTSAIEGFFNGPAWYYLLAAPLIISKGDPYSTIILQIVLWAIGGFFLLNLVSNWNKYLILPIGILWVASDYVNLTTSYAFNPNPITLLTPLFIYLLYKYLKSEKLLFAISTSFLGGLFFNFEMNFGIFVAPIIFLSILISKKNYLLKSKNFWIGFSFFIICLMPQVLFDIKHDFIMTKSVTNYLENGERSGFNLTLRIKSISASFFDVFSATLMNHKTFALIIVLLFISTYKLLFRGTKDLLVIISLIYILVPYILYLFLPVTVNPWHLGGETVAGIILVSFMMARFLQIGFYKKFAAIFISLILIYFAFLNISNFIFHDRFKVNMDPSAYRNEIAAIDYVYIKASGKNFKVYTYLPSVYDYPYQYLFWWYGKKQYGYIPGEYVYSPNKPKYIPSQDKFQGNKNNFSGLVFLIKEPDRIGYRTAWENDYKKMEFISKEWVGPLEVEMRKE